MLPCLRALGQLQALVLKDWHYTYSDFNEMYHLSKLRNLQARLHSLHDVLVTFVICTTFSAFLRKLSRIAKFEIESV